VVLMVKSNEVARSGSAQFASPFSALSQIRKPYLPQTLAPGGGEYVKWMVMLPETLAT
jgi:hypothetical protein